MPERRRYGAAEKAADLDVVQTGAWILRDVRPLPAELEAFLDGGAPPVYVGFGSMRAPSDIARVAIDAIRAQGRRTLIARGWVATSHPGWNSPGVAQTEAISLALTSVFGLVATVGVVYQVIDIRQRSREQSADVGSAASSRRGPAGTRVADSGSQHTDRARLDRAATMRPAPSYPYAGGSVGSTETHIPLPPRAPRVVLRARLLLLITTILISVNIAFLLYISQVEYGAIADGQSSAESMRWLGVFVAFLIVAIPMAAGPTILSVFIARGSNWSRLMTVILFGLQGLVCGCTGVLLPIMGFTLSTDIERASAAAYTGWGVASFVTGALSLALSSLLLSPNSNKFFRAMAEWKKATVVVVSSGNRTR